MPTKPTALSILLEKMVVEVALPKDRQLDSKIFGEDFEVLPLGIGKNAYRMQEDILFCKERGNANSTFNELVVMSPFLSESVIADFNLTDRALSDCKRTLVTRRSELGKLKASDVDNFTIYALKDEIIC